MIKTNLITDFFKNINPAFSKYIHKEKPKIEVSADNPDIMPAYAHDYGNYVARYGMGNFMIQVMMKFDGRLDFDKLKKAVRLSVDQEPVLGCRFVEDDPPYWKRREDIDSIEFCTIEETDNIDEAVNRFLETTIDMDKDPMVKVKLIRSDKFDTLGIKINHTCSDGSGSKDYVNLLSHIYTCLDSGNGVFEPKPIERSRKDHEKIFETLGIEHPEQDNSMMDTPRTIWPFLWKSAGQKDITPFAISRLPEGQLDVLSKYAKERNATINDLVFTAFYRAMFKFTDRKSVV